MTLLTDFKDKQILVLGAGITGLSCARLLASECLSFAVNDSRSMPFNNDYSVEQFKQALPMASLYLGYWNSELIAKADVILISPGIDSTIAEIAPFIKPDCQIIGDIELFCQINNQRINPISILAVTGSNGKSTVVSLLAYLAQCLGVNAQLGGNIGQPVLDVFTALNHAESATLPELLILELSSFQLETLTSMRAIATTVLNVSDDHLDRHQNMANYRTIKQSIYKQGKLAITNRDDKSTNTPNTTQPVLSFGSDVPKSKQFGVAVFGNEVALAFGSQSLIGLAQLPLAGMHNALNYLAALALGYSAGWSLTAMVENLQGFIGLAHRCQRIATSDNITWINDSKATNVGATIAAINGLVQTFSVKDKNKAKQKLILIAGGDGKGADFSPLKQPLTDHVSHVITLGKDGDIISDLAQYAIKVSSLKEAVAAAKSIANVGDIVLLSPACASLDMFKNFAQRGDYFSEAVKQLTETNDDNT